MADYICREAILDDLEKEIEAGNIALDEDVWINKGLRIAIRDIKDIKTAEVQPIRHGRWIPQGDDMWLCSNCKENIIFSMHESDRTEKQRYCCKCGARMGLGDING